jgi:hypothetical protein
MESATGKESEGCDPKQHRGVRIPILPVSIQLDRFPHRAASANLVVTKSSHGSRSYTLTVLALAPA